MSSYKTVSCLLAGLESNLRALWEVAAEKNTPLVNALFDGLAKAAELGTWVEKGRVPESEISRLMAGYFEKIGDYDQPQRYRVSAIDLVQGTFDGYCQKQRRLLYRVKKKRTWLEVLKTDEELSSECGQKIQQLYREAEIFMLSLVVSEQDAIQGSHSEKLTNKELFNVLMRRFEESQPGSLEQCVAAFLLKNGCKLPDELEDPEKLRERRGKCKLSIDQLSRRAVKGSKPTGRDLRGERSLQALEESKQAADGCDLGNLQTDLLHRADELPFPIEFRTAPELLWAEWDKKKSLDEFPGFKERKGPGTAVIPSGKTRILVAFPGFSKRAFEVRCGQRQEHWFRRFFQDWRTWCETEPERKMSGSLFTLRTARLIWAKGSGKGPPWLANNLYLHCTVDPDLWTAEGTSRISEEVSVEVGRQIEVMQSKEILSDGQQDYLVRLNTQRKRLDNIPLRPRSRESPRPRENHIVVGIRLWLDNAVTIAAVDCLTGKVLEQRGVKGLLGDEAHLLDGYKREQRRNRDQRREAQKRGALSDIPESGIGEQLDRVLARRIVEFASKHRAGSLALAELHGARERIETEIQMQARLKHPDLVELQNRYAHDYKSSVARWSYRRLLKYLKSRAHECGINVEMGNFSAGLSQGEKARELAISAYALRSKNV